MSQDNHIISQAVAAWYRHYRIAWDDSASSVLCDAAIELYNSGRLSSEDIAATLICNYIGKLGA